MELTPNQSSVLLSLNAIWSEVKSKLSEAIQKAGVDSIVSIDPPYVYFQDGYTLYIVHVKMRTVHLQELPQPRNCYLDAVSGIVPKEPIDYPAHIYENKP